MSDMNTSEFKKNQEDVIIAEKECNILKTCNKITHYKESRVNLSKQMQRKAPYDSDIVKEILTQSNRYKNLKPSAVSKIFGERPKYENLKRIALLRLEENLQKQFQIFSQINENMEKENDKEKEEVIQNEGLNHGIFSWNWKEFLERRMLKSFVWVDILLRMKETRLHSLKYQKDLKELQFFLNKIFCGFLSNFENKDTDVQSHIGQAIAEAKKALYTLEYLEKEFSTNSNEFQHLFFNEYLFVDARRNSEERMLKTYLENRISNSHILDPIEVRYQINWFNDVTQQNKYRIEKSLKMYETDISRYRELERTENFINGNCLDFCYSSIEDYKNRIAVIQNKYEKELDEMETKLSVITLNIEKLREQRIWLESEIERFHYEEEEMRLHMENDLQNEEEQKQATVSNA